MTFSGFVLLFIVFLFLLAENAILRWDVKKYKQAILKHMKQTSGHSSCWENDLELWKVIDKTIQYPHKQVPSKEEFLKKCCEYRNGLEKK